MSYMPRDLANRRYAERERERERRPSTLRDCRRETNYFPQQHASMLFTAHNELFERLRSYREYKMSPPPPAPALSPSPHRFLLFSLRSFSCLSIFFPALWRNAPEYFCPANFPIANDLDDDAEVAPVHLSVASLPVGGEKTGCRDVIRRNKLFQNYLVRFFFFFFFLSFSVETERGGNMSKGEDIVIANGSRDIYETFSRTLMGGIARGE